jgi:hypothetical protein
MKSNVFVTWIKLAENIVKGQHSSITVRNFVDLYHVTLANISLGEIFKKTRKFCEVWCSHSSE